MFKLVIPTLAAVLLFTAACASTKKPDPPPPAAIAAPAPVVEANVPAVANDGISIVTCEKGKDHRTLDLRTKGTGCETVYTKGGQAAVVATGQTSVTRCEATLSKIKQKLVAAGYRCQ